MYRTQSRGLELDIANAVILGLGSPRYKLELLLGLPRLNLHQEEAETASLQRRVDALLRQLQSDSTPEVAEVSVAGLFAEQLQF